MTPPTLPHDPGRLLPLVRGHVGEVDRDVDDGLVEPQLVQRVADDLAVAAEQEPHRDGHLALGGVVLKGSQQGRQVSGGHITYRVSHPIIRSGFSDSV